MTGTLSIVIPALDEQDAIADTIRRCLAARAEICAEAGLEAIELIVVSDGSRDTTERIAQGFPEVTVLAFERNRGYGAAIQCGFGHARGEVLGFLDADGTCDPHIFGRLCAALADEEAAVVVGSRMGPGSEMPRLRTLGNRLFAWLLGVLSKRSVEDTASGMRVLRRSAYESLLPLPEGLHFTPAMTARILLEERIHLVEIPMPYAERVGRSKLSVLRDGVRFLTSITRAAATWRPARLLLPVAAALTLAALLLGMGPTLFYGRERALEEWMIYRLLLATLLATIAGLVVSGAVVAERIAALARGREPATTGLTGAASRLFAPHTRRIGIGVLLVAAVALNWSGIVEFVASGKVYMHWSRALLASLLVVAAATVGVTGFLLNMLDLIHARRAVEPDPPSPDRVRPGRDGPGLGG